MKRLAKPQLEAQRQIVGAMLQRKSRVARQMREAGLAPRAMVLLGAVAVTCGTCPPIICVTTRALQV